MSDKNYLQDLFIDEAKPALQRHSGGGGSVSKVIKPLTIGQNGVYDATQGIKDLRFGALNRLRDKLDMKGIEAAANAHEDLTWGEDLYFYSYYGAVPHNTQYREVDIYTIRLDNGIMTIRVYDMISLDTEEVFHVYTYIPAENIEALDVKDGDGWYEVIYDEEDTEVGYARVDAPQVMLIETHDTVRFKEILENFIIEELLSPCDGANPITVEVPERELVDVRITMNGEYDAMYFGHYEDRSNKGIEFTLKEKIDMDALYQYAIEAGYASPGCILCSDDTLGDKITVADAGHWTIICTKSPDTDEERIFTYVYGDEMIALTNVENGEGWYLTRDNGDGTRTFIFSNPPKMEIDYIEDAGFAKFVVEDLIREYGIGKVTVDVPRAYALHAQYVCSSSA